MSVNEDIPAAGGAGEGTDSVGELQASVFQSTVHGLMEGRALRAAAGPGLLAAFDDYDVLRVLGAGGMGVVFLARDRRNRQRVAIKMLRAEWMGVAVAVERFEAEARHMRQMQHPGILSVMATGESGGAPFFVMPFMERGSLAELLKPGRPLPLEQALGIARQLAAALGYAHDRGIIHRDLKPANVLMAEDGSVRLADFGLARTVYNDAFVDAGELRVEGTAPYMSPAVAEGKAEDTRCDIYSLGALLYEMLGGRAPYAGVDRRLVMQTVIERAPEPLQRVNAGVSVPARRVVEWAMARRMEERYPSMALVERDVERVGRGLPPLGPRGREGGRLTWWRWLQDASPLQVRMAVVSAMICVLLVPLFAWAMRPALKPVGEIRMPGDGDWSTAFPAMVAGRVEPVFVVADDDHVKAVSLSGAVLFHGEAPHPLASSLRIDFVEDLMGDASEEVVVSWSVDSTAAISVLNQNLLEVRRFTTRGQVVKDPLGVVCLSSLRAARVVDLDGDGRRELIAAINTLWGEEVLRGAVCFDFETGEEKWVYETGAYLYDFNTVDLDGDGLLEIVCGTGATDNGNIGPDGTDDRHSYVLVLRADGSRFWMAPVHGGLELLWTRLVDWDRDGRSEVLAWNSCGYKHLEDVAESGIMLLLDAAGVELRRVDLGVQLFACEVVDLDEDGVDELLVTDRKCYVHVLGQDLAIKTSKRVMADQGLENVLKIGAVEDLDGDGHPEICLFHFEREELSGKTMGRRGDPAAVWKHHRVTLQVLDRRLGSRGLHLRSGVQDDMPSDHVLLEDLDADGVTEVLWPGKKMLIMSYRP